MGNGRTAGPLNKRAGKKLREIREGLDLEQKEFAARLTEALGDLEIKPAAYSNYEAGKRPVPAAVLLAAAQLGGLDLLPIVRESDPLQEEVAQLRADLVAVKERVDGLAAKRQLEPRARRARPRSA